MAKALAKDLEKHSPGRKIIIYTDRPNDFCKHENVIAFKHNQQSTLRCVNDKRFLLQKALSMYQAAIHIDADTKVLAKIPEQNEWFPGITACHKNLLEHMQKTVLQYIDAFKKVASKIDLQDSSLENALWIGESIYVIARDEDKELEFFRLWGMIANYMELKGLHPGDGNIMGLAAAKVGMKVSSEGWDELSQARKHLDASFNRPCQTFWELWKSRLGYHYRLNRSRIQALKHFDFYYR